jgi:hypothetical protein
VAEVGDCLFYDFGTRLDGAPLISHFLCNCLGCHRIQLQNAMQVSETGPFLLVELS